MNKSDSGPHVQDDLIDRKVKTRREEGNSPMMSGSPSRIWLVLAIFFCATSLALAVYIIYFKVIVEKTTDTEDKVVNRFPGYFRTFQEQTAYEVQYKQENDLYNITRPPTATNGTNVTCGFSCSLYRNRREAFMEYVKSYMTTHLLHTRDTNNSSSRHPIYHGCCISYLKFISPDNATDFDNNVVKLIQFANKKQYFTSWQCKHVRGCTGCGCAQETNLFSAVVATVVNNKEIITSKTIKLPGCCKCLNNLQN